MNEIMTGRVKDGTNESTNGRGGVEGDGGKGWRETLNKWVKHAGMMRSTETPEQTTCLVHHDGK